MASSRIVCVTKVASGNHHHITEVGTGTDPNAASTQLTVAQELTTGHLLQPRRRREGLRREIHLLRRQYHSNKSRRYDEGQPRHQEGLQLEVGFDLTGRLYLSTQR
jgi:hypothetical protein